MALFLGIDGNSVVANLHTLSIILLIAVIVIAAIKTFPRLIIVRKNKDTGAIRRRIDRSRPSRRLKKTSAIIKVLCTANRLYGRDPWKTLVKTSLHS